MTAVLMPYQNTIPLFKYREDVNLHKHYKYCLCLTAGIYEVTSPHFIYTADLG